MRPTRRRAPLRTAPPRPLAHGAETPPGRCAQPRGWTAGVFSVVRVEHCSSPWINALYPADISAHLSPREVALLTSVGQSGRMFNGGKTRVLGVSSAPAANGERGAFTRYTVPALELRRLLAEARERGESFAITYTLLDGPTGDEAWRRRGDGRTVTLEEDGRGGSRCTVRCGGLLSCACTPTDLAQLPPPGLIARKLLVQQAYPILDDGADVPEVPCFGP